MKIFVKKSNFSVEKFGKCELCQNRFFQNVPPRGGVVDDCRIEKRSSPTGHVTRQKIYSYRILVKSKNGNIAVYTRKRPILCISVMQSSKFVCVLDHPYHVKLVISKLNQRFLLFEKFYSCKFFAA